MKVSFFGLETSGSKESDSERTAIEKVGGKRVRRTFLTSCMNVKGLN